MLGNKPHVWNVFAHHYTKAHHSEWLSNANSLLSGFEHKDISAFRSQCPVLDEDAEADNLKIICQNQNTYLYSSLKEQITSESRRPVSPSRCFTIVGS